MIFAVFYDSGFERSLCGSKWETLTVDSKGINTNAFLEIDLGTNFPSTARYGCCPANKYMSSPAETGAFSVANSCSACPSEFPNDVTTKDNDETSCNGKCPTGAYYSVALGCQFCEPGTYNDDVASRHTSCKNCILGKYSFVGNAVCQYDMCPKGSYSSGISACVNCGAGKFNNLVGQNNEAACQKCKRGKSSAAGSTSCDLITIKIPNGCEKYPLSYSGIPTCHGKKEVTDWSRGGTATAVVVATYGLIENWDMSEVTELGSMLQYLRHNNFNADISKWDVSRLVNMNRSKFNKKYCYVLFFQYSANILFFLCSLTSCLLYIILMLTQCFLLTQKILTVICLGGMYHALRTCMQVS